MIRPPFANTLGLPAPYVKAVEYDDHVSQGSHISVTEIPQPPQVVELQRRHAHEIVEDVADRAYALWGTAMHVVLERAANQLNRTAGQSLFFAEERWETTCRGWRIACRCDLLSREEDVLTDWKECSVWEVKRAGREGAKPEWIAQTNLTALLAYDAIGYRPKALQIVARMRDWRKGERRRYGHEYPPFQIQRVPIPLWSLETARAYLDERVALHQRARSGETIPCTPDEQYATAPIWAVRKQKNQRAERGGLHTTEAAARAHAARDTQFVIDYRPPRVDRCAEYCRALDFCAQGRAAVLAAGGDAEERER